MLSPICDNTRLILGFIAALGGILFASMTSVLKSDITNLYGRLIHRLQHKAPTDPLSPARRTSKFFGWTLLIVSFLATILVGPYVAAVPSKTCVNLVISELVCNPEGDELTGEYVKLQNLGDGSINLNQWTLCDYQSRHCYQFKAIVIRGHSDLTIWTNSGTDTATDLYFGEKTPIWTNAEDTAYLYDVKDQLIYQLPCP